MTIPVRNEEEQAELCPWCTWDTAWSMAECVFHAVGQGRIVTSTFWCRGGCPMARHELIDLTLKETS